MYLFTSKFMKTFGANILCDSTQVLMIPITMSVTHEITCFLVVILHQKIVNDRLFWFKRFIIRSTMN